MHPARLLLIGCLASAVAVAVADAAGGAPTDGKLLEAHDLPSDGPGLLDYFRKRGEADLTDAELKRLVEQLDDDDFDRREDASKRLVRAAGRARAALGAAAKSESAEVRFRAGRCLEAIDKLEANSIDVVRAAVRQLALRRPAGTVAALLKHLGRAENAAVSDEIRQSLIELSARGDKADPALIAALASKSAAERCVASLALLAAPGQGHLPAVRKLLGDDDEAVRLPVAVALARRGERAAVPVLLAAMDRPPSLALGAAEDVLFRLAGQDSPRLEGDDAASLRAYRLAWQAWWKKAGDKADLAVLREAEAEARASHTTVVLLDENTVIDLDKDGKERWSFDKLGFPLDVQRLPGERVLLAEMQGNRVTERDRKGAVVWEKKVVSPLAAQRLPNGNTFVATPSRVFEYDADGKEVSTYSPENGNTIMRARKLPGGELLLVLELGVTFVYRIDRFGKVKGRFAAQVNTQGGRIDVTPAGNVLVPEVRNNRVQERDADGKLVREFAVADPIAAHALPNGHVLVTSMSEKRAIEFDRAGREVWQHKRDTRVTRAVRP